MVSKSPVLVLYQFRPAYDVLAYLTFSGGPLAQCIVENVDYPRMHASAQPLPCLRRGREFIPQSDMFTFLKREYADLEAGLSLELKAESRAFASMLLNELTLCLDYIRYGDEEHWRRETYPALVRALPFPFGRLVARKLRHDMLQRLDQHHQTKSGNVMEWALQRSREVYLSLSQRLGEGKYVLNTVGPTTVDALLFGHLCQARVEPGLCDILKEEEFANLELAFQRSLARVKQSKFYASSTVLFPGPDVELIHVPSSFERSTFPVFKQEAKVNEEKEGNDDDEEEDETSHGLQGYNADGAFQAGLFAVGTLGLYALVNGLIAIREEDSEY